jgi:hypothetical protein
MSHTQASDMTVAPDDLTVRICYVGMYQCCPWLPRGVRVGDGARAIKHLRVVGRTKAVLMR